MIVTDASARVHTGAEIVVNEAAPRSGGAGAPWRVPGAGRAAPAPATRGVGTIGDDDIVFVDAQVVVVRQSPAGLSTVPYEDETDTLDIRVRAWLETAAAARRRARARRPWGSSTGSTRRRAALLVFYTFLVRQAGAKQRSFRAHTVHRRCTSRSPTAACRPLRTIRSFLLADRGDGLRGSARGSVRSTRKGGEAREAITHVEAWIEALDGATLIACRLETGRTHQIRIHLSELGHPVLGERVYTCAATPARLIEAPRLMLHAAELGFTHPITELPVQWERGMPADMLGVLARLGSQR